ncbi:hypothetical protein NE237_025089 [Protea cynaroides]|uniref:Uncharacterized protein n=1 Tax=Protea cynaroides TaxID=273540 RepID=A0A9Q0K1E8_9MAGN|nr:hypothetical protein NE237_025089 [Protea cynaroides]
MVGLERFKSEAEEHVKQEPTADRIRGESIKWFHAIKKQKKGRSPSSKKSWRIGGGLETWSWEESSQLCRRLHHSTFVTLTTTMEVWVPLYPTKESKTSLIPPPPLTVMVLMDHLLPLPSPTAIEAESLEQTSQPPLMDSSKTIYFRTAIHK